MTGYPKPIRIGRNAWVGYHSIVLKGVNVGENSVVGAGAVVTQDVPDNAVVFGNPARQHGWACQCGIPLHFRQSTATCSECGRQYRQQGDSAIEYFEPPFPR